MSLFLSLGRNLWTAVGGHCAVWEKVWPALGPTAGGTVCRFYSGARSYRRGALSDAWPSQPCQRSAGFFWLWREAPFWQVSCHHQFQADLPVAYKLWQEWPCSGYSSLHVLSTLSFSSFKVPLRLSPAQSSVRRPSFSEVLEQREKLSPLI